jgi:hypothetical protein
LHVLAFSTSPILPLLQRVASATLEMPCAAVHVSAVFFEL